jgi:hypothetical protein
MNRWQKIAWFNLSITAICFIACLALSIAMEFKRAVTPPTPLSLIIIPSLVLVAISKLIFGKKPRQLDFDERDRQIHKKSAHVGLWAFVISTVLAITAEIMICFIAAGPRGTLPYPLVLFLTICAGGGVWIAAESISILAQYGRRAKDNE